MNRITEKVKSFLEKYGLLQSKNTIVVAFSGGYDSMCMLDVAKKFSDIYKFKIVAAHLNHNWRGEESLKEAENCEDFANNLGVEFYCEALSKNVPKNETSAREERYKFFERCAEKYNSKCVLTAHNANDNAETILYRIIKGTGTIGLQGIKEKRGIYYRPLLATYREEIEKYCRENNLKPNIDTSNDDIKYKRNFIRHKVIPLITEINPNVEEALNSLSQIAVLDNEIIEDYIKNIDLKDFHKQSKPVKNRIIHNILTSNNIDYDREKIGNILEFTEENSASKSGKIYSLTTNLWLFVNYKGIKVVLKCKNSETLIQIIKEGKYETDSHVFEIEKYEDDVLKYPKEDENYAYVDLSNFDFDYVLRTRPEGGTIRPFGLDGTQKLRKYLIDKKIPKHEKEKLLFFCKDDEVLWIPEIGLNNQVRVLHKPTHMLRLTKK